MATFLKSYTDLPLCEREIRRYAGCKTEDAALDALLQSCLREIQGKLTYKVCYCELPLTIKGNCCDFGAFCTTSAKLTARLEGCERVVLFAATVGLELDRLIAKYGHLSPSKAVILQAIGAERIEALCDAFCEDMGRELALPARPRFSPGYGDLPLAVQKDIFRVLDCSGRLGLTLNDSLLMSPSKSVTAFVGFGKHETTRLQPKCSACDKRDCIFRGASL